MTRDEWNKFRADETEEYNTAKSKFKRTRKNNTRIGVVAAIVSTISGILAIRASRANRWNDGMEYAMDAIHEHRHEELFPKLEKELFNEEDKPTE